MQRGKPIVTLASTKRSCLSISRAPGPDELQAARRFLETQPSRYPTLAEPERRHRALVDFCQMMLASNAFLYVE